MSESRNGTAYGALNPRVPSVARMYDFFLGGKDNYLADRAAAREVARRLPQSGPLAVANRRMIARGVRAAVRSGVRQVVDLGGGLPTRPSTLDAAREASGGVRVVLADHDPVVASHYRAFAPGDDVHVLEADLHDTEQLLKKVDGLIELDRPALFVLGAVLHFVRAPVADEAAALVRERIVPGGHLLITHATGTAAEPDIVRSVEEVYQRASAPLTCRPEDEIRALFGDLALLDPGLTDVQRWRGDPAPARSGPGDPSGAGLRVVGALGVRAA
ncbi:SAM-dependent methyltransferase [Spirillospora sp. NBC_01491]|uniref:SAM-dependent methyltransferase n=1 Tax=Spirillospora sp. NBC_01491 TaxID=2976007 RepID=UPI002E2FDE5C|nr:SAM-dependent methyltransferase [Spirillospora sp. NBC_01491]